MFRRIQNESLKEECIRVRIRSAFLTKKGAPRQNFHREGGAVAPTCPPKSATARAALLYAEKLNLAITNLNQGIEVRQGSKGRPRKAEETTI